MTANTSVHATSRDELPPYRVPHSQEAIRVLYRDEDILIVDKPHLLLSVPGRHPVNHDSLIGRVAACYPGTNAVHRLDLDTSGLMVVPRHRLALSTLSKAFQARAVAKEYRAVVWGRVYRDKGRIELPIISDWHNRPRQKVCEVSGKPSLTQYEVLERGSHCTLLRLIPVTGRSHQLRIHLKELGHPILGCDMYAHHEALAAAPRLLLHASHLAFQHPRTGVQITAYSPAPFTVNGVLPLRPG